MRGRSEESNFINHRVRIKLEGFKPERIISAAVKEGITLRKIRYVDETEVRFTVSYDGYTRLKKRAGSVYRMSVIKETGGGYGVKKFFAAKLMLAGIGIFAAVFVFQSIFVREINVVGCRSIPEQDIRTCIKEEGLYEGGLKNFDCSAIEKKLFTEFDTIVWARVAYDGNYVEVQIAESEKKNEDVVDRTVPCNVIAEMDCYVERILSYRGTSAVSKDDFVPKGGILISGVIPIEKPSFQPEKDEVLEQYVHADGKVVARVPYGYSFEMAKTDDKKTAETMLRQWIKKNIPEKAQILNKSLNFEEKKNIIRVYGTVETRQQVGIKEEIIIGREQSGTEEDNN